MKHIALATEPLTEMDLTTPRERTGLRRTPLLLGLPEDIQHQLQLMGTVRALNKGAYLFFDGEAIQHFHYVLSGRIKEYYAADNGDHCLRRIAQPGHYLSLHQILSGKERYTYSAMAIFPTRCCSWRIDLFRNLMNRTPELSLRMARLLSDTLERSCRHTCLCRKTRALAKVAGYLLSKNHQITRQVASTVNLEPGLQIDLRPLELTAAEICLTRETFSRILSCLDGRGLIQMRCGMVELLDEEGLKQICAMK